MFPTPYISALCLSSVLQLPHFYTVDDMSSTGLLGIYTYTSSALIIQQTDSLDSLSCSLLKVHSIGY